MCVCVFFLFLNAYRKAIIHQKQVITIKHTHIHTRILYNNPGSFSRDWWPSRRLFLSVRKQNKNSRQRKTTTTNIVSFLSLYLCGIKDDKHSFIWLYFFNSSSLFRVHWLPFYLLPRRCQLSFPFFLLSSLFFVRLKSTEQSITSHTKVAPFCLQRSSFSWSAETSGRS